MEKLFTVKIKETKEGTCSRFLHTSDHLTFCFQHLTVCTTFRCQDEAAPRRIGGQNEIVEWDNSQFFQGPYRRGTDRLIRYRFVVFQRNSANVMCIPAAVLDRGTLVTSIHAMMLPDTTVVLADYGIFGGIQLVRQTFQQTYPNVQVN